MEITHLNLATNVVQVLNSFDGKEGDRGVTWLPFFHDMGLITILLTPVLGLSHTFMTPAAFVRRPIRWLRELSGWTTTIPARSIPSHRISRSSTRRCEACPKTVSRRWICAT
ncbi:AMP-binding enzyme family protein [Mycobacterium xenopi 3993]|nr:AMP-binding enzyme family protein [Mycobacterium xenopi 3993]